MNIFIAASLTIFTDLLVKHGVISREAIEDAEGYDAGRTEEAVWCAYEDRAQAAR